MPIEIMVKKGDGGFYPASDVDAEVMRNLASGKAFRMTLTKVNDRSIKHHRLYFGGLIKLVANYWQTDSGLIPENDRKLMRGLIEYVAKQGVDIMPISTLVNSYMHDRAERIKARIPEIESAADTTMQIHQWLKVEAGYCDVVLTPTGIRKEAKSINFNAMSSEAEFMEFYKRVFSVAWKYIFSNHNFSSQEEAEKIAYEISMMG